jgi:WS/DGAT/MGAT family acyltransferase
VSIGSARLSATDLINLAVETPHAPMQVGAVAILDGRPLRDADGRLRLADLRSIIDRRLDRLPQLRRVTHRPGLFAGRPLWVDDATFRIDRHVSHVLLPAPGDREALLSLAMDLLVKPLDRTHPLWRMWFVTGLPRGEIAVVMGMHHVVADGVAALRLVTSLLDPPAAGDCAPVPPWEAAPAPHWRDLVRDNVRTKLAAVRHLARRPHPQRALGSLLGRWQVLARSWRAPRTSLNAPVGSRRRLAVMHIDLADVKRVAHSHHGKVNDVILSLAAAGLRAVLHSRAQPVDRLRLHVNVAVSLRTSGQTAEAGNRTGGIIVRLPLGEPDPHRRLRLVVAESADAKRHELATTANSLLVWLARLGLLQYYSRRQHLTNLMESNVTGPPATIHLLGAPVLDVIPIGTLVGNVGLAFLALSYAGRLAIAVQADADRFPDLPVVLAAMERDWGVLQGAIMNTADAR